MTRQTKLMAYAFCVSTMVSVSESGALVGTPSVSADVCRPDCVGKTCGSDGCGGSCGGCAGSCDDGACHTTCSLLPATQNSCAAYERCVRTSSGVECVTDDTGATCTTACDDGFVCVDGHCDATCTQTSECRTNEACVSRGHGISACDAAPVAKFVRRMRRGALAKSR